MPSEKAGVISEDNENVGKYKIVVEFGGIESDSAITVSPFNSKPGAVTSRTH